MTQAGIDNVRAGDVRPQGVRGWLRCEEVRPLREIGREMGFEDWRVGVWGWGLRSGVDGVERSGDPGTW